MTNQWTSITTTPGIGDETVKAAYDLAIGVAYRKQPTYRQWVTRHDPVNVSMPGSSVILNKYDWLADSTVTAAKTPLNEEQDVDSTKLPPTLPITLTLNEFGFPVSTTKKLRVMSFADVDFAAAASIADHMGRTVDSLVQDVMRTGTNVIYSGTGNAATADVAAGDTLTSTNIRTAVTLLRGRNVPAPDGEFFLGGAHPYVIHDLRQESGSGGWRTPNEYGQSQSAIWRGEFGEFEGVRFIQNPITYKATDGTSSRTIYRTYIQGPEVIAEMTPVDFGFVMGPTVDKLNRFRHVGWYGIGGWALYRDESIERIESASTIA